MSLNISRGNMYGFVTHTWNTVKGRCPHDCSYCYMKRFPQKPLHFDDKELKTDLGNGNFIFVGSSCDMWAPSIPNDWICKILDKCRGYQNKYLFQTKNPNRFLNLEQRIPEDSILCTTIETNRVYHPQMGKTFSPESRAWSMNYFIKTNFKRFLTIEPILDFDLSEFVYIVKIVKPEQVNIGADSGNNHLPEPSYLKIKTIIEELKKFTKVVLKPNLKRLLKESGEV